MLPRTAPREYRQTVGYVPGALEAELRQWALRYWPDSADDDVWQTFRAYYGREYVKQLRGDVAHGRAS